MMKLSMLLVVLGMAAQVNASFEMDVMGMKSSADPLKPLLATLAQMTTEKDGVRKLGGHDNMSEEDQKALMKCMQACPDLAKMGQAMGGDPDMEMVCNMMKCISDNDECAVIQKMMGGGAPPAEGECDRAGQMRDGIGCLCGSGCPVSTDMMKNPVSMCASWDCWNTKDECKPMLNAKPCEDAEDTLGPVKCICNSATKEAIGKMMTAGEMIGAPEGTCNDATADPKDKDSIDICALAKDAPDGDCAMMMVDAMDAMKGAAVCEGMVKMMEEGQDDAEKKCVEDISAAVEAKKEASGGDTATSFAAKAALPSLAMLAIVGLLRA
jgi:hypothetical protein